MVNSAHASDSPPLRCGSRAVNEQNLNLTLDLLTLIGVWDFRADWDRCPAATTLFGSLNASREAASKT